MKIHDCRQTFTIWQLCPSFWGFLCCEFKEHILKRRRTYIVTAGGAYFSLPFQFISLLLPPSLSLSVSIDLLLSLSFSLPFCYNQQLSDMKYLLMVPLLFRESSSLQMSSNRSIWFTSNSSTIWKSYIQLKYNLKKLYSTQVQSEKVIFNSIIICKSYIQLITQAQSEKVIFNSIIICKSYIQLIAQAQSEKVIFNSSTICKSYIQFKHNL